MPIRDARQCQSHRSLRLSLATLVGALVASGVGRAEDVQPWELVLQEQIRHERNCEVSHYVSVKTFRLSGEDVIDGRLRCVDGREFTFTREKAHQKFKIESCEPAVC